MIASNQLMFSMAIAPKSYLMFGIAFSEGVPRPGEREVPVATPNDRELLVRRWKFAKYEWMGREVDSLGPKPSDGLGFGQVSEHHEFHQGIDGDLVLSYSHRVSDHRFVPLWLLSLRTAPIAE
ncbi:MAG: hypothetical protein OXG18_09140 [Gemmatimonadetes bacterium]|nr:hypothetical protein [Gemmatimonadota bacterium]